MANVHIGSIVMALELSDVTWKTLPWYLLCSSTSNGEDEDRLHLNIISVCATQRSPDQPISQDQGHFLGQAGRFPVVKHPWIQVAPSQTRESMIMSYSWPWKMSPRFMSLISSEVCCLGIMYIKLSISHIVNRIHSPTRVPPLHCGMSPGKKILRSVPRDSSATWPIGVSMEFFPKKGASPRAAWAVTHRSQCAMEQLKHVEDLPFKCWCADVL